MWMTTLGMISKPVMQQWQKVNSSQSLNQNHMDLFIVKDNTNYKSERGNGKGKPVGIAPETHT